MPQGQPPPVPVIAPKPSKKKKEKTPKQLAERRYATQQAYESLPAVQQREFNQRWQEYNEIYAAYHGGALPKAYAQKLINRGITFTTFAKYLTTLPAFYSSQVWKQQADKFYGPARNMGMKVDKKFVAKAIANNWDPYVFQEKLRQRPEYLKSNEFRTTEAGMTNAYRGLYGDPDQDWAKVIKRAAIARWTPDQWQAYLRQQPGYRNSTEYQETLSGIRGLLGYTTPLQQQQPLPGPGYKPPPDRRVR